MSLEGIVFVSKRDRISKRPKSDETQKSKHKREKLEEIDLSAMLKEFCESDPVNNNLDSSLLTIDDMNYRAAEILRNKLKSSQKLPVLDEESVIQARVQRKAQRNSNPGYQNDSIRSLLEEERNSEDIDKIFCRNVVRLGEHYQGTELGPSGAFGGGTDRAGKDEDADIDLTMFQSKRIPETDDKSLVKELKDQKAKRKSESSCEFCRSLSDLTSYLDVSNSSSCVLRLKHPMARVVEGHCELLPIDHCSSFLRSDDPHELLKETEKYKTCLRRMFERRGQEVVFTESAVGLRRGQHARVECLPLPKGFTSREVLSTFKEAMLSLGSEAQEDRSHQRRLLSLSRSRPLSASVPARMEYVAAWCGEDETGLAIALHGEGAIDSSESLGLDSFFGVDVIRSLIDEDYDPILLSRDRSKSKSNYQLTSEGKKEIEKFREDWSKYDWTRQKN